MDPIKKPQIPDLNLPAPQDAEAGPSQILTMQDPKAKFVEVEATTVAVTSKRKAAQAYQNGSKRFKGE
ncbi:hypothetical protein PIB30_035517 [Stylosanthes scabra]|uniref:Uncharacterized protein n=1 Tax=Stylosanthes scabra TaxID=79078 RepID=A0ABU6ZA04_9FABA|nr:hypothetical protein [Stylosanthes scabra]